MVAEERVHPYVVSLALVFALLPYDYIIKVVGNLSLAPFLLLITLVLCLFKTTKIKSDKLNTAIIALALIYDISIFWSRGSHIADCISFTLICAVFVMVRSLELTDRELNFIEVCTMIGSASLFLYVVGTGGGLSALGRLSGRLLVGNYYSDPNGIAARQFLGMAIAIKRIMQAKRFRERIVPIICMLLSFVVFVLAASRGAYVAFVVFILVVVMGQVHNRSNYMFKAIGIIIILLLLFSVAYEMLPARIQMKLSMSLYLNGDTDVSNGRGLLWSTAITKLLPKMPPWGYGISGSAYHLREYVGFEQTVHNIFLQCLLEMGYLGFIFFIKALINVRRIIRDKEDVFRMATFIGVMVIVFFLSAYEVKYFWMTLLYCTFVTVNEDKDHSSMNYSRREENI